MKRLIFGLIFATATSLAHADSLSGEVRFVDNSGRVAASNKRTVVAPDATEYKVEYGTSMYGVNLSIEANTKQEQDEGKLSAKYSAKAGPQLPVIFGLQPSLTVELGQSLASGDNYPFVGYGVGLSRPVFGDLSVNTGYRFRQELEGTRDESRYNVGLTYAVTDEFSAAVQYYVTVADRDSQAVGFVLKRKL